jgi:type II restriction enzyme
MPNIVDYDYLVKQILGKRIPKPLSGTLSGHAAGEPFDKYVYGELKKILPNVTFRQYEFLNALFSKHPTVISYAERLNLFQSPTAMFLLTRGKNAVEKWSPDNVFDEKQNDTADILIAQGNYFEIIDIKTRNHHKTAQPPNIISAYKLAQVCALMIDNTEFESFSINYFEIDWIIEEDFLKCIDCHYANLFKSNPNQLYINWAAAMQLQFHVSDLGQGFDLGNEMWAREYLKHFVTQARKRASDMIKKFVVPFEKYI